MKDQMNRLSGFLSMAIAGLVGMALQASLGNILAGNPLEVGPVYIWVDRGIKE